jgi:hypothetical protein
VHDGAGALKRREVHGPGEDDPLVWYEGAGLGDTRWYHAGSAYSDYGSIRRIGTRHQWFWHSFV